MKLALLLTVMIALSPHAFAGEHQYVALTKSGQSVILWTDRLAATNCARATIRGSEQDKREFCEVGAAGTVGRLDPGTEVERLDPRACGDLVQVRVLGGPLTGGVGCISGGALTRLKPE